jgi:hypothetical protein
MNGLIKLARDLIKHNPVYGYVYGAQGQIITQELLNKLKSWYGEYHPDGPTYYEQPRTKRWIGYPATDCSGLVCSILSELNVTTIDMTADTLKNKCTILKESELVPGDLTFVVKNGRAVHVGIYNGNNETIQARGTDYGLVITTKSEYSNWNAFGRLNYDIPDIEIKETNVMAKEKSSHQKAGEHGITLLHDSGFLNSPEVWKAKDLEPNDLWAIFTVMGRMAVELDELRGIVDTQEETIEDIERRRLE